MRPFPHALWFALVASAVLVGCGGTPVTPPDVQIKPAPSTSTPTAGKDGDHGHKSGLFGGIIVPVGRDNYHAEAVFEKGGVLRLYTLGQDESRILEVDAQTLAAFAKVEGGTEATEFALKPEPRDGDAKGKTSRFVGTLPDGLAGRRVEVTIPTLRVGGERFRVGFASASAAAHAGTAMPAAVVGDKERQVFLVAGGKYTDADIRANKSLVPSQKFKDFVAEHDDSPKPGDLVCPVTNTKANPECSWVVDGQTYSFCCPPCVTDFVKTAKTSPDKVKKAADYRKAPVTKEGTP